ncbi:unnamed protein product [Chrysoparadoxa australica]
MIEWALVFQLLGRGVSEQDEGRKQSYPVAIGATPDSARILEALDSVQGNCRATLRQEKGGMTLILAR